MAATATNGITGGDFDAYGSDRTIPRAMTAFAAIAWYNTLEILVLSAYVFKRYAGVYFWSVVVSAVSIAVYATGAWTYQNVRCVPKPVADGLMTGGWVVMIPAQSIVLWSRLHLVTHNRKLLRFLLWMIIVDSVCCIVPTCVFNWGALMGRTPPFYRGYNVIEKIQMCVFTTQEVAISVVYLLEVRKVMATVCEKRARGLTKQLVYMNLLIIFLDLAMLVIEFCNLFMIQVTIKSMVYSVKLKVEFAVLSKIISVARGKSDANRAFNELSPHKPHWNPALSVVDREKDAPSLQISPAGTPRAGSTDLLTATRFQSMDTTRVQSIDGGSPAGAAVHAATKFQGFDAPVAHSLKYPEAAARASADDEGRYVRSLQQNVPANWRLSIGHEALTGPNLFEIRQLSLTGEHDDSIESVRDMYPGRLE